MMSIASTMMIVMAIATTMMIIMSIASTVMIVMSVASAMMIVMAVASTMMIVVMALVLAVFHRNFLDHDPGLLDRDGLAMFPGNLPAFLQRNGDWTLHWNILTMGLRHVKTFLNQYKVIMDC